MMKDKRILSMFITSIVTFVASLTISLGVAFALADPASAVGLEELKYDMTSSAKISQELTFDPTNAYRGSLQNADDPSKDAIFVHNYDSIQYYDGILAYNIKLVKVEVTNNNASQLPVKFAITTDDEATNKFLKGAVYCVSGTEDKDTSWVELKSNGQTEYISISANSTAYFVVATYVDDTLDSTGTVSFAQSKTMTITVEELYA